MTDPFVDEPYKSRLYPDYVVVPRPQPSDTALAFFGGKKDGLFVDIGAHDGNTWSNSLPFELNYGWSGICIEPQIHLFKKLVHTRKARCMNVAVSDQDGVEEFTFVPGDACAISGLTSKMDQRHLGRIDDEVRKSNGKIQKAMLTCRTLTSILDEYNMSHINYLSIDTEGSEPQIIAGIDFSRISIDLISMEVNYELDPIVNMMEARGYKYLTKTCGDCFFTKRA